MKEFKYYYKSIFSYFFIFLLFTSFKVIQNKPQYSIITVVVEKDSYVSILGKTNVNKFTCAYQGNIPADTVQINVIQKDNKIQLKNASLSLNVNNFDCGNDVMNKDFKELLKHNEYPKLNINVKNVIPPQSTKNGDVIYGLAEVNFTIAGNSKAYEIPVYVTRQNDQRYYVGSYEFDITDFNLTPPTKFLGMVKVDEEVVVDFRINLQLLD